MICLLLVTLAAICYGQTVNKCGFMSPTHLVNFDTNINNTNTLVLFPRTEQRLKQIVRKARANGCKIRVRGSGHSNNGLIVQNTETNVVVVHLGELQSKWANQVDTKTCLATIQGGNTFLDLIAMARPLGCVLQTQTAFPMFTIAGVVANQVAGNGHRAGLLYDYVVSMRVMLASGEIVNVVKEKHLRFFRGSYGLTGIILAVKYQLQADMGVQLKAETKEYNFIQQGQLAMGQFIQDQTVMHQTAKGSECFFIPYPTPQGNQRVTCFVEYETGIKFPTDSAEDKARQVQLEKTYLQFKQQNPNLSVGSTRINIQDACVIIPAPYCYSKLAVAAGSMDGTIQNLTPSWEQNPVQDGYFVLSSTVIAYRANAYYVPLNRFPEALGAYLQLAAQYMVQGEQAPWLPNTGFEFRLVTPQGTSAFDTLTPGVTYVQIEILNMDWAVPTKMGEVPVMQQIEQIFMSLGGVPHAAKYYGLNQAGVPFQSGHKFYTPAQRDEVKKYLKKVDPKKSFSAGSALLDFDEANFVPYTEK